MISFAPGYPSPETFPWDDFRDDHRMSCSGRVTATTLQYGPTRGFRPLLDAIRGVLSGRGIEASLEELLVTTGSQQGLDLVARVLLDPGDVALRGAAGLHRRHRRVPQRAGGAGGRAPGR